MFPLSSKRLPFPGLGKNQKRKGSARPSLPCLREGREDSFFSFTPWKNRHFRRSICMGTGRKSVPSSTETGIRRRKDRKKRENFLHGYRKLFSPRKIQKERVAIGLPTSASIGRREPSLEKNGTRQGKETLPFCFLEKIDFLLTYLKKTRTKKGKGLLRREKREKATRLIPARR